MNQVALEMIYGRPENYRAKVAVKSGELVQLGTRGAVACCDIAQGLQVRRLCVERVTPPRWLFVLTLAKTDCAVPRIRGGVGTSVFAKSAYAEGVCVPKNSTQEKHVQLPQDLVRDALCGEAENKLVILRCKIDTDGRVLDRSTLFRPEVIQVHVHLSDIVMLDAITLEINQNKTMQKVIVKDEINAMRIFRVERNRIFARDPRKALAKFKHEHFQPINERRMRSPLGKSRLGLDAGEFKNIAISENIHNVSATQNRIQTIPTLKYGFCFRHLSGTRAGR